MCQIGQVRFWRRWTRWLSKAVHFNAYKESQGSDAKWSQGPDIVECSLWTICTVSHIWIVMNSLLMLWSQFLATSQTEMLSLNHDCKKKGKSNGKFQLAHLAEFFKCLQWRYSDFNGDYIPAILIKCIQDSQVKNFLTNFLNLNLVTFNWKIMTFYFKFF